MGSFRSRSTTGAPGGSGFVSFIEAFNRSWVPKPGRPASARDRRLTLVTTGGKMGLDRAELELRIAALPRSCRRHDCDSCAARRRHVDNALEAANWDEDEAYRAGVACRDRRAG